MSIQNTVILFVSGIAETEIIIMLIKTGPKEKLLLQEQNNIKSPRLVQPENVFLPSSHIKLGRRKHFVKAMDRSGDGFLYVKEKFPKLSKAKIKEGIFVGNLS